MTMLSLPYDCELIPSYPKNYLDLNESLPTYPIPLILNQIQSYTIPKRAPNPKPKHNKNNRYRVNEPIIEEALANTPIETREQT